MRIHWEVALVVGALGFLGCSQSGDHVSAAKDVSLPGGNGGNVLLWTNGGEIFEGKCPAGALAVRANCENAVRSSNLDHVVVRARTQLGLERDEQQNQRDSEVWRLKDADPTVMSMRSQLRALELQINTIASELEVMYADANDTESAIAVNEVLDAQYTEQLAAIAEGLAEDPDNIDLRRLQIALTDEQAQVQVSLSYQNDHLVTVQTQIAVDEAEMSAAQLEQDAMNAEFDEYYAGLTVSSSRLDEINAVLASFDRVSDAWDSVLAMLANGGIAYRGALLKAEQQDALQRLRAGFVESDARIEQGVLQVRYDDEWRGVCDDSFGREEAIVACRMMGQSLVSYSLDAPGPSGNFWLDNVACDGNESDLFACGHNGIGHHNCSYYEHVALVCE